MHSSTGEESSSEREKRGETERGETQIERKRDTGRCRESERQKDNEAESTDVQTVHDHRKQHALLLRRQDQ
jgi:hypothetical protein